MIKKSFLYVVVSLLVAWPAAVLSDETATPTELAEDRETRLRIYGGCRLEQKRLKELEKAGSVDWENAWQITVDLADDDGTVVPADLDCNVIEKPEFATATEKAIFDEILADESCFAASGKDAEKEAQKAEEDEAPCEQCTPEEKKKAEMGTPDCWDGITCSLLSHATKDPIMGPMVLQAVEKMGGKKCTGKEPDCIEKLLNGILKSLWETVYVFYDIPKQAIEGINEAYKYVEKHGVEKSLKDVKTKIEDTEDSVAAFAVYMARKRGEQITSVGEKLGINDKIRQLQTKILEYERDLELKLGAGIVATQQRLQAEIDTMQAELDGIRNKLAGFAKAKLPSELGFLVDRANKLAGDISNLTFEQTKLLGDIAKAEAAMLAEVNKLRTQLKAEIADRVKNTKMPDAIAKAEERIRKIDGMSRKLEDSQLFEMLNDPAKFLKDMGPAILDAFWGIAAMEFGCNKPGIHLDGINPCPPDQQLPGWECATCAQKASVVCNIAGYVGTEVTIAVVTAILTMGTATAVKYGVQGSAKLLQMVAKGGKLMKIMGNAAKAAKPLRMIINGGKKIGKFIHAAYKVGKGAWKRARIGVKRFTRMVKKAPVIKQALRVSGAVEDKAAALLKKLGLNPHASQKLGRRMVRTVAGKLAVSGTIIGVAKHQKYVTPEPGETMTVAHAPESFKPGRDNPAEAPKMPVITALEQMPGLGRLASHLGDGIYDSLAALKSDDVVVFSGADASTAMQFLDEDMPKQFAESKDLQGTTTLDKIKKIYMEGKGKRPVGNRAKVTMITDTPAEIPAHLSTQVQQISGKQVQSPVVSLYEEGDKRPKLIVDINGAFEKAPPAEKLAVLTKYLKSLHDEGTIYLTAKSLDTQSVMVGEEVLTLREWFRRLKTFKVEEPIITGIPTQPVVIRIAPPFQGDEFRAQVLESIDTAAAPKE